MTGDGSIERAERRFLDAPVVRMSLVAAVSYCIAMVLAWVAFSTRLPVDWAFELVLAQELRAYYAVSNPPLYTWIAWVLLHLAPPGQAVFLIVNYTATMALFCLYAYAAHLTLANRILVAIAPWSLFLILPYGRLNFGFVNTQLLLPAVVGTVILIFVIVRQPRWSRFAALGLVAGLGTLSKLNYLFAILCILLAAFWQKPMRDAVLKPGFLLAAAVLLAIVAPFAFAFHGAGNDVLDLLRSKTTSAGAVDYLDKVTTGLLMAGDGMVRYLGPAIGLGVAGVLLVRRRGGGSGELQPDLAMRQRFLRDLLIIGFVAILAGIVIFGMSRIKTWYMHAFFLLAPLYALTYWDNARLDRAVVRLAVWVVVGFAIAQSTIRIIEFTPHCIGTCRDVVPYDGLARQLRAAGFRSGTIVSNGVLVPGNLMPHFPNARVGVFGPRLLPKQGTKATLGQCLAIWRAEDAPDPAKVEAAARATFAAMGLSVEAAGARRGTVRLGWHGWSGGARGRHAGVSVWHYLLIAGSNKRCG